MTARPRLLVLDAPGGPRPHQYLPSLCAEFDVHVVWLNVEEPVAASARREAVAAGRSAVAVDRPAELPDIALEIGRTRCVHGVLGLSERTAHTAALVARQLGLPANPSDASEALRDKRMQRSLLAAAGLPTPWHLVLRTEADCQAGELRLPAVLKPTVGMGSLATFRIGAPDQLLPRWRRARELVNTDARVAHLRPDLVLEQEWLGDPAGQPTGLGDYLSVETLTESGRTHVLAVSDKLPLAEPFRENGHLMPTIRTEADTRDAVRCVLDGLKALGVTTGACHTEVKLTRDGPRIIEINGRPGGFVPELLWLAAGYDLPRQLARVCCGLPAETRLEFARHAACLTPQPPVGRHHVRRAPARDQVAATPGVVTIYRLATTGSVLDSAVGSAHNLFRLSLVADDRAELLRIGERLAGPEFFELVPENRP
jgi:biotin carboxylase